VLDLELVTLPNLCVCCYPVWRLTVIITFLYPPP